MELLRIAAAESLLGCRRGASRAEVQAAYRRALHRERPDLGAVDGEWVTRVQSARDLLLACAPPDRRRRPRREAAPASSYLPLRRSSWGLTPERDSRIEVRL
jgi:hypothetical protein